MNKLYKVVACEKSVMQDGKSLFKIWIQNDNGGLAYLWSSYLFQPGDDCEIRIRAGKDNRASCFIVNPNA